jgi:hypothetical protein
VAYEDHIAQFFRFDEILDVVDRDVERSRRFDQMTTFAKARQRRRKHAMASPDETVDYEAPAPAAVPRAVN